MTDFWTERDEVPAFEVRVMHDGKLVHCESCETTEQAALVAEQWGDTEGTSVEIVDLRAPDSRSSVDDVELFGSDDLYDSSGELDDSA